MRIPARQDRPVYVRRMFGRIAQRYDLMNRIMTLGRDSTFRRCVIQAAALFPGARLLDIGTGTGAIVRDAYRDHPDIQAVGADFTVAMIDAGRHLERGAQVRWSVADALHLPFADNTFDAVTSGYLIRNVGNIAQAFDEQVRVLKPGGRLICLDTSPPPKSALHPLVMAHFRFGIPLLGRLIAGDGSAYRYLPQSTSEFLTPTALAAQMHRAGLRQVRYQRFMFGTIAVHVGICPNQ